MKRRTFLKSVAPAAAIISHAASKSPLPLGRLEPFWRHSPVLGPFLESGIGLMEIPQFMLRGDFAYRKRPYPREVPFADHLSLVRLLGGYNDGSSRGAPDASVRERDLAYRGEDGGIRYRMHLLKPRLQPYLDSGYTSLTLVLDNVPWCFPEKPGTASLGQYSPPRDPKEWHAFIKEVCRELSRIMGADKARQLRFRVGTENNGRQRFNGTYEEYLRHYDYTAAAVMEVLPGAKIGPFNISGVSLRSVEQLHNVRGFALAEHCFNEANLATGHRPTPLDFVAFSRYYRPGDDPEQHAQTCREVWEEFGRRVPQLKNVSREIHEFGIAPWSEVAKGVVARAEPGAMGGALTSQMMFRLRAAGINRLWHWGLLETRIHGRKGEFHVLPHGEAWVLMVADRMAGGEAYLLPLLEEGTSGTQHLAAGSFQDSGALLMISAYHLDIARHTSETVRFRVPAGLFRAKPQLPRFVRLSRSTSVYDRIRNDLATAGLLKDTFVANPDYLGSVREMAKNRNSEVLVAERLAEYTHRWEQSLQLAPLAETIGKVETDSGGCTLTLRLAPPEVLVIAL